MFDDQQLFRFRTFSFVVLCQLFTPEEVEVLCEEYEGELYRVYPHQPFDGSKRHWTMMLGDTTPLFDSLLEDPRSCNVAEQMYSEDVIGFGCDANRYIGHTRWHPDHYADPARDYYGMKFAFYYSTPYAPTPVPCEWIPRSHLRSLQEQVEQGIEGMHIEIDQVPVHVCEADLSDVAACSTCAAGTASWGGGCATCVYYNNPKDEL